MILSVNGRIRLLRRRYQSADGKSETPVDRLLDAARSTVSVAARQLCCRLGVSGRSFARSAENLKAAAQISVSEELLRGIVEAEGKAVLATSADEQLELDWSARDCVVTTASGTEVSRIYASCDGVLIPTTTAAEKQKRRATVLGKRAKMLPRFVEQMGPLGPVKKGSDQRYKQIYVTILYDQSQTRRLVGVTRKNHKGLGKLLNCESRRVELRTATERIGLVDGAVCLRTHLSNLPLQTVLLDFYHLSEHVNDAKRKTLGEKTEAGETWAADVLHALRHEGYDVFFQKLLDWRTTLRGSRRKVADKLINYTAARQEMMNYAECDAKGWDVGTGPMESMCGVTTDRLKGRGRRWDLDNAEAMMALEGLYQSNLWDRYWNKALQNQN
jgi:hypothetical protein